jgi:hypothetical protein
MVDQECDIRLAGPGHAPDPIANRAVWNAKESKLLDHVRDDHRL